MASVGESSSNHAYTASTHNEIQQKTHKLKKGERGKHTQAQELKNKSQPFNKEVTHHLANINLQPTITQESSTLLTQELINWNHQKHMKQLWKINR